MRKNIELYQDLFCQYSTHEYSDELKKIATILEKHNEILISGWTLAWCAILISSINSLIRNIIAQSSREKW